MATFSDDVLVQGNLRVTGSRTPSFNRSEFTQENLAVYPLPWTYFRQAGAFATNLSSTSSGSDLALVGGTWATGVPSIQTSDLKNVVGPTTRYARCQFQLPPEYVAGETVTIRLHAGMVTTIASTTGQVDLECYKSGLETIVTGSDLCTTAPTSCNSLTFGDKDFAITSSSLSPGDIIDIRVAIIVSDSATGTAVIGCIGSASVLLDIKG